MSEDGSEGSPPRPLRRNIKKVMVLSSASESDSDESVVAASTRRKRLRVLSDDGASSSSGSSVVARRRRALPALRDSDADSDTSGWATDHSDALTTAAVVAVPKPTSGFASDSSEGNSDKCSICLLRFKDQEVGTPENCEHIFCLDCITEWSKNVNTCPVDRMTFNSIVVRACAGGRVLRTEPVTVVERRPSVEVLVVEDPTPCEICGRSDNEETMLLCDGCDLGYHMQCLTPPLTQVPIDEWLCPNCDDLMDVIHLSELDDLFSGMADFDLPEGLRAMPLRELRNIRRSLRSEAADEPSTSNGRMARNDIPSTSRGPTAPRNVRTFNSRATTRRRTTGTHRRKYRKRRARTLVIEYEVEENGKTLTTKTVKRKLKKRKCRKRQPRTAARRTHVRASVRAKLAGLRADVTHAAHPARPLGLAAPLSLFGDHNQLHYFEEEEHDASEGATTAVAARPSPSVFSAYRQARRKMISIPSPPHATAAPDILSSIMESQALLHSPRAVLTLAGDGRLDIKPVGGGRHERVDPAKQQAATRSAPAYGGGRGGGWGGGYRGARVPPASPSAPQQHYAGGGTPGPRGPPAARRGDADSAPLDIGRRPPHYEPEHYGRARRENGRGAGYHNRRPTRYGPGPPWPPAPPRPPPRLDDPLDMRTAGPAPRFSPMPEPPVFKFDRPPETDRSEDEEPVGLVIDTEKYDPTEPTHDDDSPDEEPASPPFPASPAPAPASSAPEPPAPAPAPSSPPPASAVQSILAGIDTSTINVPAGVLDSAVRQVLQEHRGLMAAPSTAKLQDDRSDGDSDGDCPNFAIYSATSVHIASNTGLAAQAPAPAHTPSPAPRSREDEYKEKVSKRCPITTNTRNPIKIKLNTPSLIKRQVSLYDEEEIVEDVAADEPASESTPNAAPVADPVKSDVTPPRELPAASVAAPPEEPAEEASYDTPAEPLAESDQRGDRDEPDDDSEPEEPATPDTPATPATPGGGDHALPGDEPPGEDAVNGPTTDDTADDDSESELGPAAKESLDRSDDPLEKMTESISETEDERSYTPCLDENKSKDTSLETEREKGIEGLDTEMISEEEGNDMFSDEENRPPAEPAAAGPGDKPDDDARRKRKKESKKEAKDKKSKNKKSDISFKKLSKNGKERNYRDKDKDRSKKERRDSAEAAERKQKRKEKRKDLERYDVRTVVSEKRKRTKDAFGRDVSPRRSRSGSSRRASDEPRRRSPSPRRKSASLRRKSISPRRKSLSPRRKSISPRRRSISPRRKSISPRRRSVSGRRGSPAPRRKSVSPQRKSASPRRASPPRGRKPSPRRRRSASRGRKRRRSASKSPKPKAKKKKRARSERDVSRRRSPRRKSPKRKRAKRSLSAQRPAWSAASVDSRLLSPRTPPPAPEPPPARHHRRDPERRHRRRSSGPSKEVFTSGDNILVSVSFKDQERDRDSGERRKRREAKRDKRRRRRRAAAVDAETVKPVAIIDLERSPFREITPSPKNVIVLSDSDHAEKEPPPPAPAPEATEHHVGPKTPPEPAAAPVKFALPAKPAPGPRPPNPLREEEARGPATPPDSPDAYDPFEPTASPEPPPADSPAPAASPPRPHITLEGAQKTNMSADDVIDRRPISPIEKVMALLQSTRDVSPEPPPGDAGAPPAETTPGASAPAAPAPAAPAVPAPSPAAPRIVLPSPTRTQPPKLFLAKPSPIKSNPVKPMQATKISRLPLPGRQDEALESPYSPGSSDFGDLFEPPGQPGKGGKRDCFDSLFDKPAKGRRNKSSAAKVPVKLNRNKGNKTQVGIKIDEDNLKILDDLPSSAVEMQVKSKFLKKLNRQERVVEEVKLVLKPHYNKKHVTKDEYKDILRRAVPKICHNKSGEINPAKIQALVEAYVKKFRKKHKLGLA